MTAAIEQCHRIAEEVCRAWNTVACHAGERIDIPLGTTAALCLSWLVEPASAEQWRALDETALRAQLAHIWAVAWRTQPYLVEVAAPLHTWLDQPPDPALFAGVRAVLDAALRAGLPAIIGSPDVHLRSRADLLGMVLIALRSPGAREGLAEFPTPPDASTLASQLLLATDRAPEATPPPAGVWFGDDTAGTGDLFRSTAQYLRGLGADPGDYCWYLGDVNPLAAAAAAVNAMLWGLGDNVLVHVVDTLATADGAEQAAARRRSVLAHHARITQTISFAYACQQVQQLTSTEPTDQRQEGR
ncbi:hypothetical protein [Nocardia brasiliensis]|uniref:hypothetical protein n=1 Tax=Nocardia brasiliensis TaxID=37326 RepID=UPI0024576DA0|nr:hypothetical protein [Nocardia brasiliensis]